VESLSLAVSDDQQTAAQPEALQTLLQLSALTCLEVYDVGVAAETVMSVAAQLTGLKGLRLQGLRNAWQAA
jgi:hypothetical protein